jgi:hypothetical protein
MNLADEMAAEIKAERRLASAAAGSDPKLGEHASLEDSQPVSHQLKPVEDLHNLLLRISHHLDYETSERKTIYYRLLAIESQTKKRPSRGFAPYLVAICIGVAGTLAWQAYGEATKQIIATRAPELGWSPEAKQMIASWVQQLGWTKPLAGAENTAVQPSVPETPQAAAVARTAPETVAPTAPAAPSLDPEQMQRMAQDVAALRQIAEQLAAGQDQMAHDITRLQAADLDILAKIPAPPPPPAAPARKPMPAPSSRAPIPPH